MRWARHILIAISVVIVLVGLAMIVLLTIDLGRFKSNVEHYVSEATGREFVIVGNFQPSIGSTVDLLAEDVRLANADWGVAENILELERLVISIDTLSLLSGPIDVLNLEVEGLTLNVEKEPETMKSSWSFGEDAAKADEPIADNEADQPFELPLWLRYGHLQRISVIYGQGWLDAPRNISIGDVRLSADESDLLNMVLSGAIGDAPIRADGLVGPLSALLDGRGPRWELRLGIGNFITSTQGNFKNLFSLEGPKIHAVMQGPLAERILAGFGLPPFARGPVDISADLTEGPDGIDLRVQGAFGDLTTEVIASAQSLRTIGDLDLTIDVRGPDLQAIGELFNAGFLPSTEFTVEGGAAVVGNSLDLQSITVSAGDARLEIDGTLAPTEVDPDARLKLSASGKEVRNFLPAGLAERIPSGAFDLRAIAAGGLQKPEVRELTATLGDHELNVEGTLPAAADLTGLDIAVAARGPDIDELVGPWADGDIVAEPYMVNARIRNNGVGFVVDDLTFELASASLALTGTSGTLPTLEGLNASLTLRGEDLQATVEPWLDIALPAISFGIDGSFVASDGAMLMSDVTYRLGEARGTLDGTTGMLPSLDGLRLNTSFAGPDASRFTEALEGLESNTRIPPVDFETRGSFSKSSAGWFVSPWSLRIGASQLELNGALGNFDGTAGIDIDIALSGPDLRRFLPERGIESPIPYEVMGGVRVADTVIELQEVNLRVGESRAWLNGRLPTGAKLADTEFNVRIAGPNLQRVGRAIDVQGLPPDDFRFEGALTREGEAYSVDDLVAVVGENDLSGDLTLEMGPRMRLTGHLASENLNLTELMGEHAHAAAGDEDTAVRDRVIPDTPLPLQVLDVADVDLLLRLRRLQTENLDIGDVELMIVVEADELHVDTGQLSLKNGGTMKATLDLIRISNGRADVAVSIIGEQFRLRPAIDGAGNPINRPPQDLSLALAGSGSTVRELAASARGSISLRQGEGDLDNNFSGYLMRDMMSQVFAAINPLAKDTEYTRLHCGFFEVDIVDGVARSRAIGLQTDKISVASVGTVNLATEALDLSFRVQQREGIGVSLAGVINPYVKVAGTLASPALQLDKRRGFLTGTVAVLTGGLSILAQGAWDRYLSRDDYCQAVIEALESGEIPIWDGES